MKKLNKLQFTANILSDLSTIKGGNHRNWNELYSPVHFHSDEITWWPFKGDKQKHPQIHKLNSENFK